jgi:hypothetical protein
MAGFKNLKTSGYKSVFDKRETNVRVLTNIVLKKNLHANSFLMGLAFSVYVCSQFEYNLDDDVFNHLTTVNTLHRYWKWNSDFTKLQITSYDFPSWSYVSTSIVSTGIASQHTCVFMCNLWCDLLFSFSAKNVHQTISLNICKFIARLDIGVRTQLYSYKIKHGEQPCD